MRSKSICSRVCLLIIFCSLSWLAVAQTSKNYDKKMLLGQWLWDETTILDDEYPMSFDLNNDYFKFYDEIDISENNTVVLKDLETDLRVKYDVNENYLGFELPSGESFIGEWAILQNKLYVEFDSFHPYNPSKKVKVLIVYRKR